MQVKSSIRIINDRPQNVLTVDGLDRCQINTRLHYLNVQMDKLKAKQAHLIESRDAMDRKIDEMKIAVDKYWDLEKSGDNLFDEMFGG